MLKQVFLRHPTDNFFPKYKSASEYTENHEILELIESQNYSMVREIIENLDQSEQKENLSRILASNLFDRNFGLLK
jgi:hypothetical protein